MAISVRLLDRASIERHVTELAQILARSVEEGAAISFMRPLSDAEAAAFWLRDVAPEVEAGRRAVLGADLDGRIVGTVQLITTLPPNQPHRCEIAKMIVHPSVRRQGIARALMTAAIDHAGARGKTMITLDTRTGDAAERLYGSLGFQVAGVVPDFAWDPDGRALHPTTYMYKRLNA
jgi:ribosomal protein S18 acetylase RimI-like enzyme